MSAIPTCKRDWIPIFENTHWDPTQLSPELREAYKNYKNLPDTPKATLRGYPGIKMEDFDDKGDLSKEQQKLKEELLSLAKDIKRSHDPEQVTNLNTLVAEFNQKSKEPFTDEQIADIFKRNDAAARVFAEREIVITGEGLGWLTGRAIKALENWNQPPCMFRRGGIVRVIIDEAGRPIIDKADEFTVRWALEECADWKRESKHDILSAYPPMDVVRNLMREPTLSLPPLNGTIEIPTLRGDGTIILKPGYDERTGLFYAPDPDLVIPPVPDKPTKREVRESVALLEEIFCDFPFIDDASRANTIATLITPILRPMIRGPVPLALFDKPAAGTGASLLAEVVSLIVTGRDAPMMTAPIREEEWDKKIASILLAGNSVVVIDNVDALLKSGALSSVLTCTTYGGRLLGKTEKLELLHRTVWMAAGINIQLGGDMPRRCYLIRMDANMSRPEQRQGFKHPELKDWVLENRGRIVAAILIICRAWVRAGAPFPPKGSPVMGSFEHWRGAVGGILHSCGVAGFLGNLDELYEESDNEGAEWERFFERWDSIWGDKPITVATITDYLKNIDLRAPLDKQVMSVLPGVVADSWSMPGKFSRKLGSELAHRNGRIYSSGLRLRKGPLSHKVSTWVIVRKEP